VPGLGPAEHLTLLEAEVSGMTRALAAADPDAPVEACPGWSVRDLVVHLTAIHRWATAALDQTDLPAFTEVPVGDDLAQAYADASGPLVNRLRELPEDQVCWTFHPDDRTASFWRRRQLHEIAVHRWDVAAFPMDPAVAADGVDEALTLFVPRMVKAGRATMPEGSLELVSAESTWALGEGEPAHRVEGSAEDLLLALWGRKDLLPPAWRDAKLLP
jgi:uncharacterized protein (TIGR03083 family)